MPLSLGAAGLDLAGHRAAGRGQGLTSRSSRQRRGARERSDTGERGESSILPQVMQAKNFILQFSKFILAIR
jgi:hypothetical protein